MRTFIHRMSILFVFIRTLLCGMIQVEQQTDEMLVIRFTQDALSYDLQTDEKILEGIVEIDSLFENGYMLRTFSSIIEKGEKLFTDNEIIIRQSVVVQNVTEKIRSAGFPSNILNTLFFRPVFNLSESMVMRDIIISTVSVVPYRYDQFLDELEIITDLEIHCNYSDEIEPFDLSLKRSRSFENIYRDIILNFTEDTRDVEYQDPAILYICGGNIIDNTSFQDLIEWRKKQGFTVYAASTGETGSSSSSIKNYIYNAYTNYDPKPEYVALVGDANGSYTVSTFYECWNHDYWGDPCEGDQPYGELVGDDLFPEVIVGRISIRSSNEMNVIANKIINYEKATNLNDISGYYERAALIADASVSGQSTIITTQYVEQILDQYGFEDIRIKTSGTGYDNWMEDQLEDGVLFFQYRGFNGASGFDNNSISYSNNGHMLPFASILTCNTGGFAEDNTSLSEAFLRAGSVSNPKGGIAAVGTATGNTHTIFNNIICMGMVSGLFNKDLQTAGQALVNGKLEMLNTYPTNPYNWISAFSQWNSLMGDPATHLWTDTPQIMTLNFPNEISFGTKYLDVTVHNENGLPLQNARTTIIKEGDQIFQTKLTDENGFVRFAFDYNNDGILNITTIKKNYKPVEGTINIVTGDVSVNCENPGDIVFTNGDDVPNPGDTLYFSVPLKNYGTNSAFEVSALLGSTNPNISIGSVASFYGTIEPGEEIYGTDFSMNLLPSIQDGEDCGLKITITDNSSAQWTAVLDLDIRGTRINIMDVSGSYDTIEPGVANEINIDLINMGRSSTVDTLVGILQSNSPLVQVLDNESYWSSIDPGYSSISTTAFTVLPLEELIGGTEIQMELFLTENDGFQLTLPIMLTIGEISVGEPTGPDSYGYYIYDSQDEYELAPEYNWVEISDIGNNLNINDPGNGRGYCSEEEDMICNSDEDCDPPGWQNYGDCEFTETTKTVSLPFTFRFYGDDYSFISISSNGWISFGETEIASFRNYAIPGPGGPSPMLAVFWDDHRTTGGGDIYTYYDDESGAFIVQWDDMDTYFNGSDNTFQAILYNSSVPPNNDSEIRLQYKEFNNTSVGSFSGYTPIHGGFCTIGIEDKTGDQGLQYTFNNNYPVSGRTLGDDMALFITTMSPQSNPVPSLYYEPSAISEILQPGETVEQTVTIENLGDPGSLLSYSVIKEYPVQGTPYEVTGGGPDDYGYFWTDSRLDTNIQFNWVDIPQDNSVEFEHNDQASGPHDIGFPFPFYGVNYDQCIINPNGWIGFGDDYNGWNNGNIPEIDAPRPAVIAYWDDLNPINNSNENGEGQVFYHQSPDSFIVWFNDVIHYPGDYNGLYDFQVILTRSGAITVNYQTMDGAIESGTIGIQDHTGTRGSLVAYNQSFVENGISLNMKYNFSDWFTIDLQLENLSGTLFAGENFEFMTSINTETLSYGDHNMSVVVHTNIYTAIIPVTISVTENGNNISHDVTYNSGWNIVGLPSFVENNNYDIVFPQANNNTLFYYDGMYALDSTLIMGNGYWLRFDSVGSSTITGVPLYELSLDLEAGWNLISGISEEFNINASVDPGNIIVSNTLYGYTETYYPSEVLIPGKGYWLRASEDGQIILNSEAAQRMSKINHSLRGTANTLTINGMDLYFGIELSDENKLSYSLPPKPPAGAFDARFKDGWRLVKEYGEVEVMQIGETLTIAYDIILNAGEHHNWVLKAMSGEGYILKGTGEITIPTAERFTVLKKPALPTSFTLHQNFPNPFNPVTTIRYDLPKNNLVILTIYDMLGRVVVQLVNTTQEAGFKLVQWDGSDSMGRSVSAGVYLYHIQAGEFVQTKKMVLLK